MPARARTVAGRLLVSFSGIEQGASGIGLAGPLPARQAGYTTAMGPQAGRGTATKGESGLGLQEPYAAGLGPGSNFKGSSRTVGRSRRGFSPRFRQLSPEASDWSRIVLWLYERASCVPVQARSQRSQPNGHSFPILFFFLSRSRRVGTAVLARVLAQVSGVGRNRDAGDSEILDASEAPTRTGVKLRSYLVADPSLHVRPEFRVTGVQVGS